MPPDQGALLVAGRQRTEEEPSVLAVEATQAFFLFASASAMLLQPETSRIQAPNAPREVIVRTTRSRLAVASGATACAATPDGRWSGRPESNRRRPAWEFPYGHLTSCHFLSEFITYRVGPDPWISRLVTPYHGIWAASWAAAAERRVKPRCHKRSLSLDRPSVVGGSLFDQPRSCFHPLAPPTGPSYRRPSACRS
jgi:hypothetical protein